MTTPPDIPHAVDAGTLAANALKAEGVFLHRARVASDSLRQRLACAHPNVQTFKLSRDEMETLVKQFGGTVDIAVDYHIGAAEIEAA